MGSTAATTCALCLTHVTLSMHKCGMYKKVDHTSRCASSLCILMSQNTTTDIQQTQNVMCTRRKHNGVYGQPSCTFLIQCIQRVSWLRQSAHVVAALHPNLKSASAIPKLCHDNKTFVNAKLLQLYYLYFYGQPTPTLFNFQRQRLQIFEKRRHPFPLLFGKRTGMPLAGRYGKREPNTVRTRQGLQERASLVKGLLVTSRLFIVNHLLDHQTSNTNLVSLSGRAKSNII